MGITLNALMEFFLHIQTHYEHILQNIHHYRTPMNSQLSVVMIDQQIFF